MQSHISLKNLDKTVPTKPDMLRMGLMERWGYQMGIISRETLQIDITTKLQSFSSPLTIIEASGVKPIRFPANDLNAEVAFSLVTGWLGVSLYHIAIRVIQPYDNVLDLGGGEVFYALNTALRTHPVGYHYLGHISPEDSAHIDKITSLNKLPFKPLSQDEDNITSKLNLISARPYTCLIIGEATLAKMIALPHHKPLPLSYRHIFINMAGIDADKKSDLLKHYASQHFIFQTQNGDTYHLTRKRV